MKGIRTIALGLALLAGAAVSAQAQGQPGQQGQPGGRGRGVAALLEGITLAADQQAKVDSIQKAFAPKMQEARDAARAARESGGDAAEAMKKMRGVNEELTAAIKAVLTTEQQAVFTKNVEAAEARRREMMQNRGGPPGV
jgi:Spy/CpxP family protein refolding chaperone